jgi:periplasmic protein TonB
MTGLTVVVVFHVFLIYALVTGLARKVVEVVIPPLETKLIEEVKPPQPENKPPPPPPPKLAAPPPPFIPPPEVRIDTPPPVAATITAVSDVKPATEAPTPQPPVRNRTAAMVDAAGCAKPEYPAASLRAHETGIVVLSFLIGVDGTVIDSKVSRTSGSRRLDEAARKGLGICHFKPATADGKPEQSWARIEYEWKIE